MADRGVDLTRYFRDIEAAARVRADARAQLDGRELSAGQRNSIEGRLKQAADAIERAAAQINAELARAAREGASVAALPREMKRIADPEVQQFCANVDVAVRKLNDARETANDRTEDARVQAIEARKLEADRVGERIRQSRSQLEKDKAQVEKREGEARKARAALEKNEADLGKQVQKLEDERRKVEKDLKKLDDIVQKKRQEAAALERERRGLLPRYKAERRREIADSLKRRVEQIDAHLKKLDGFLREDVAKQQEQLRRAEAKIGAEVEELGNARKRVAADREKVDAELESLADMKRKVVEAMEKDAEREEQVDAARKKLDDAEKTAPKKTFAV
jgi:DNA repair exonuclease SbcCD ATPase subunit